MDSRNSESGRVIESPLAGKERLSRRLPTPGKIATRERLGGLLKFCHREAT